MQPYLGPPWTNSCQIWCEGVFDHVLLKYGHENAEMQKWKFYNVTLQYFIMSEYVLTRTLFRLHWFCQKQSLDSLSVDVTYNALLTKYRKVRRLYVRRSSKTRRNCRVHSWETCKNQMGAMFFSILQFVDFCQLWYVYSPHLKVHGYK